MATNTLKLPNDQTIPVIGLGTWQPVTDLPKLGKALSTAFEEGYRLIDTAHWYENEQVIGETLNRFITEGKLKREDVFIMTKLPCVFMGERERVREGFQKSLDTLKVDHVDLYLIHWPFALKLREDQTLYPIGDDGLMEPEEVDLVQVWKALEELVDEGKIRSLGLSNFNSEQIDHIHQVARHPICNLQVECHVYFQQEALREFCKARGIPVTSYSPIGSPEFVSSRSVPPEDQPLNDATVAEIARKHSKTSAQVMIRFLIQEGVVVIPKSFTPSRIRENIQVFDFTISAEDMDRLRELDKGRKRLFDLGFVFGHAPGYPYHIPY